jgi:hypothetical protein
MSLATAALPTDPDELRIFAAALQSELYAKTLHIEKLKAQLARLNAWVRDRVVAFQILWIAPALQRLAMGVVGIRRRNEENR